MSYQGHTGLRCFEFSLGHVFAGIPEEAERVASANGMWDKRPDGTWGSAATEAFAELSADQQRAYRVLARKENEAARRALGGR